MSGPPNKPFFARRAFTIVVVMTFILPFIGVGALRALKSNVNKVQDWLPEGYKETDEHRWFTEHFPHEQFVLVSWTGCTLHDDRLELLARKLVPPEPEEPETPESPSATPSASSADADPNAPPPEEPEPRLFKSVLTGQRLVDDLQARYPELTEEDILQRLEGSLIGKDHLRTCLVVTLTKEAQGKHLRHTIEELRRIADEECNIKADERKWSRDQLEIRLGGPPIDNVAIDIEGEKTLYRLALLSAIVGFSISMFCFRSIRLTLIVFWLAVLSAGVGLMFVAIVGLITRGGSYGTCDAVLLSMPALVYVLAMSGAIHIINYYHDAIHERGLTGATDQAVRLGAGPCFVAALTTALGLGSLLCSHIVPISKFGLYSALGVMATLGILFLYLPALLEYFPSRKFARDHAGKRHVDEKNDIFVRWWRLVGRTVVRHNYLVAAGCLGVMVFFVFGIARVETSVKLMKLFSPNAEIIHHYGWLEKQLGPLVPMEIVVRFDNQKNDLSFVDRMRIANYVEQTVETKLSEHVGGALSAATFAPDISPDLRRPTPGERLLGIDPGVVRDNVLNKRLAEHRDEFREYLTVDTDRTVTDNPTLHDLRIPSDLAEGLEAKGLRTLDKLRRHGDLASIEWTTPEGKTRKIGPEGAAEVEARIEAWRAAKDPGLEELGLSEPLAARLAAKKLTTLEKIESYGADELAHVEGIGPEGADEITAAVQAYRNAHGDELWRVMARTEALSDLDYGLFVGDLKAVVEPVLDHYRQQGVEGIDAVYTGLVPLVYKTQHELMKGLVESLVLAFAMIAVVMVIVLRSPSAGLLAMVPNVFPVIVIFGLMGWTGIKVDIGSMMTASVALGVAVDDTIHFLTWYRRALDLGLDRKGAVMLAYERCATAMSQTTLIGGLGLAVFAFSTFTPTQRFGMLMLTLLAAALFGDLIFLPALLTGPFGRFFRGQHGGRAPAAAADHDTADVPSETGDEAVAVPAGAAPIAPHLRSDAEHQAQEAN